MTLSGLVELVGADPTIASAVDDARNQRLRALDLTAPESMRPVLVAALATGSGRPALLITSTYREAEGAHAAGSLSRRPERVEAWAALADAAAGKEPVVFETSDVLALLRAVSLAKEYGLDARYVVAPDAHQCRHRETEA